jgi:CBS domain-containing protein
VTPFLPVRDVMSPDPVRIDGFATVQDALALMRERAISALVVERRDARDATNTACSLSPTSRAR